MTTASSPKKIPFYQIGKTIHLGPELARGGEGVIRAVTGKPHLVAKLYHKPSAEKTAKLKTMLANPPVDIALVKSMHISIAWPNGLIFDEFRVCVGFTMPYISHSGNYPLLKIYNPRDRRNIGLNLHWGYLMRMAYNLSVIIQSLHDKKYVVGDLNESNILVTPTALVTLVDCDSIQVPNPDGGEFYCPVGKPEYTSPEMQGKDFSSVKRKDKDDDFALAVLIFLLLMEGRHPFAGVWHGDGPPRTLAQNIEARDFPYAHSGELSLPRTALPFQTLPQTMQTKMRHAFVGDKNGRHTASEWVKELEKGEAGLVRCPRPGSLHVYSKHLKDQCPWCARMEKGILDPFPAVGNPPSLDEYPLVEPKPKAKPKPPRVPSNDPTDPPHGLILSNQIRTSLLAILTLIVYLIEIYIGYSARSSISRMTQASPIIGLALVLFALIFPIVLYLILAFKYTRIE